MWQVEPNGSWRPGASLSPRCHGFYRFFVFEGALALVLLNLHVWTDNPNRTLQAVSSVLLFSSIPVGIYGFWLITRSKEHSPRDGAPENFAFENTTQLITHGVYTYIRHPMYTSLLLLAWGALVKEISVIGIAIVLLTTAFLIATAKVEERENLKFFGSAYRSYMGTSKMFIPYVF